MIIKYDAKDDHAGGPAMSGASAEHQARTHAHSEAMAPIKHDNFDKANFGQINWDAYGHRGMWDMVQSAQPATMGEYAQRWAKLGKDVGDASVRANKVVQELMASWKGKSASAAAQSATRLTKWGGHAAETSRRIGDAVDRYTEALQTARNAMPEPVHPFAEKMFAQGHDVDTFNDPAGAYFLDQLLDDHLPTRQERLERQDQARQIMENFEAQSKDIHDALPEFSSPPPSATGGDNGFDVPITSGPYPDDTGHDDRFDVPITSGPYPDDYGHYHFDVPIASGPYPDDHGHYHFDVPITSGPYPNDDRPDTGATSASSAGVVATPPMGAAAGVTVGGLGGSAIPPASGGPAGPIVDGTWRTASVPAYGGPFRGYGAASPGYGRNSGVGRVPSGSAGSAAARIASGLQTQRGFGPGRGMFPPMAGARGRPGGEDHHHRRSYGEPMDLMEGMPTMYPTVISDD